MGYIINFRDGSQQHFEGEINDKTLEVFNKGQGCLGFYCINCTFNEPDCCRKGFYESDIKSITQDEEIEIGDEVETTVRFFISRIENNQFVPSLLPYSFDGKNLNLIKKSENPMSFSRIRDEKIQWLVDTLDRKRFVVGFDLEGYLITEVEGALSSRKESEIKEWRKV